MIEKEKSSQLNDNQQVKIHIAYDSSGIQGFESGWGFSALITVAGKKILFDCGWDSQLLRRNIGRFGFVFSDINSIFLSHGHWDHSTALPDILNDFTMREMINVFVPSGLSKKLIRELSSRSIVHEIDGPTEIMPGIWSTGTLGEDVKEHAMIIRGVSKGIIITGCAHPGIGKIIETARSLCEPIALIGGFHDSRAEEIPTSIQRVLACHCTSDGERMKARLGECFTIGLAGQSLEIDL